MRYLQDMKKDKIKFYTFMFLIFTSIAAVIARIKLFPFMSLDMWNFIIPWSKHIKENGGFFFFSNPVGNYTPPYYYFLAFLTYLPFDTNYSVKVISCIFDFIMAVYCAKIIFHATEDIRKSAATYAMVLFLPTIILNSGTWGQCDVIYTCFVVMSLYYMLVKKEYTAYVLYGIAFSFKLQAIFALPFIIIMILKGYISFKKLWAAPLACFLMMVPAVLLGDNLARIFGVYINQGTEYSELSLSIANLWAIIKEVTYPEIPSAAVFFAGAVVLIFMYYMLVKQYKLSTRAILTGMAFFTVLVPFVLPHMHDRYYYMGVVFTILATVPDIKNIWLLLVMEAVSSIGMTVFLFSNEIDDWTLLSAAAAVVIYGLFRLYTDIINSPELQTKEE